MCFIVRTGAEDFINHWMNYSQHWEDTEELRCLTVSLAIKSLAKEDRASCTHAAAVVVCCISTVCVDVYLSYHDLSVFKFSGLEF